MMFLFFIFALFYSIHMIPKKYQVYLLWNPCLHFIKLSRSAFFPLYCAEAYSIKYIIVFKVLVLFLGLSLYRIKIKEILSSE